MLENRPTHPSDLGAFQVQANQASVAGWLSDERWQGTLRRGPAWTMIWGGAVVAMGGIEVVAEGRAIAWSFVDDKMPVQAKIGCAKHAARMVRQAKWLGVWRVEAYCRPDFEPGKRLLAGLGFEREGLMRKYLPDQSDLELWARVT